MQANAARVAQIGNLLTSPVFLASLASLLGGFVALWNVHFDPASSIFVPSLVTEAGSLGAILVHWGTGAVSISSTTMFPQLPTTLPPGTHEVTVRGPAPPPLPVSIAAAAATMPVAKPVLHPAKILPPGAAP
jgi:hypothetical protein